MRVGRGFVVGLAVVAAVAGTATPGCARADEAHDLAARIVARTGEDNVEKMLALVRQTLVAQIVQKSGKTEAEAGSIVDDILLPSVRRSLPEIRAKIVSIYAATYSIDDLRGLDRFYDTPVGRDLIAKSPQIAAALVPAAIAIIQTTIQQTLAAKSQELKARGVDL